MLTKRIIPCLDVTAGRVVKGVSFLNLRDAGDPIALARFYDQQGADELVFLDITASADERRTIIDVVEQVSEQVFIPLTVGGGVRTSDDVRNLLNAGADKVSMNTAAVINPKAFAQAASHFGNQCMVIAIDARRVVQEDESQAIFTFAEEHPVHGPLRVDEDSRWEVLIHGGRTRTGIDAIKWAAHMTHLGAGEILLTSMDTDGHVDGYDVELTRTVADQVSVPVIASGGAGHPRHMADVLSSGPHDGHADAALAATIFHYGQFSIKEAKAIIASRGLPIRED